MNLLDVVAANLPLQDVESRRFEQILSLTFKGSCETAPSLQASGSAAAQTTLRGAEILFARCGSATRWRCDEPQGRLLCFIVVSGAIEIRAGETRLCRRGDSFAMTSLAPWEAKATARTSFLVVVFESADTTRLLERLCGHPPREALALSAVFGTASPLGRTWTALIAAGVAGIGAIAPPTQANHSGELLQDSMIALLLEHLPHNLSDLILRERNRHAPWPIRKAIDFIRNHPPGEISVASVAAAVDMSARTLQQNFQRFLDVSPKAYIKAVRLKAVRRELLDAGSRRSIEEIATAWGFTNRGHFAAEYRRAYGELPSQTRRSQ